MSKRDFFHDAVKNALIKDGWTVTHDPYELKVGGVDMAVDLGAERILAAEKDNQKIAIEIKSFISASEISEFHTALGQFINYKIALAEKEPARKLYLAVPKDVYDTFFQLPLVKKSGRFAKLKLIVYQPITEEIVKWKN